MMQTPSYRRNREDRTAKTASWHSLLHFTLVRGEKEISLDVQGRLLLLKIQIITKSTALVLLLLTLCYESQLKQ